MTSIDIPKKTITKHWTTAGVDCSTFASAASILSKKAMISAPGDLWAANHRAPIGAKEMGDEFYDLFLAKCAYVGNRVSNEIFK